MISAGFGKFSVPAFAACLLVTALSALAQINIQQGGRASVGGGMGATRRPAGPPANLGGKAVVIQEVIGTGRQTLIRTPEYKTSIPKSSGRPKEWVQITARFDTTPEWINVLTLEYIVLVQGKDSKGKEIYSLYRQTVEHPDVEAGRDHLSVVYIAPSAVLRYGMPIAVHVNATADGEAVAQADDIEPQMRGKLKPGWYQDRQVLDMVTVRDGYLWRLFATPFAFVNADDYEVMR